MEINRKMIIKEFLFIYLLIFISFLIGNFKHFEIFNIVYILLFIISIFLSPKNLLFLCVILVPFNPVFKFFGTITIIPLLVLVGILKYIVKYKTNIIDIKVLVIYLIISIISIVETTIRYGSNYSTIAFLAYTLYPILTYNIFKDDMDDIYQKSSVLFILSVFLYCIFNIVFLECKTHFAYYIGYGRDYGFSNVWDFGTILTISLVMILTRFKNENMKKKLLDLFLSAIFLYFLYKTGLYSAIVGLAIAGVLYILFVYDVNIRKKVILLSLFTIIGVGFLSLLISMRGSFSNNGRFAIWTQYCVDFLTNISIFLFGIGPGAIQEYAHLMNRLPTHNIFIEKIIEFGVVGILLLIAMLYYEYKDGEFNLKNNIYLLPLIAFIGISLTQDTSGSEIFIILLCISFKAKKHESFVENNGGDNYE